MDLKNLKNKTANKNPHKKSRKIYSQAHEFLFFVISISVQICFVSLAGNCSMFLHFSLHFVYSSMLRQLCWRKSVVSSPTCRLRSQIHGVICTPCGSSGLCSKLKPCVTRSTVSIPLTILNVCSIAALCRLSCRVGNPSSSS